MSGRSILLCFLFHFSAVTVFSQSCSLLISFGLVSSLDPQLYFVLRPFFYMCSVRGLGPRYGHGSTHRGLGGRGSGLNDEHNHNNNNLNGDSNSISNGNRNGQNNNYHSRQSTPFQAFKAARLAVRPILHDDETATVYLDRKEEDLE